MWEGLDTTWAPEFETIIPQIIKWYNADSGTLILSGGYGCGKTHIAKRIFEKSGGKAVILEDWIDDRPAVTVDDRTGNIVIKSVQNAIMYAEPELLENIRESYKLSTESKIVRECNTSRLLVIDDIGAAYFKDESSRWYQDLLWRIMDSRSHRKNLITTNLTPPQLKDRVGGRVWSRFNQMLGLNDPHKNIINMFGIKDYRQRSR